MPTAAEARATLALLVAADVAPVLSTIELDAILLRVRLIDAYGALPDDTAWAGVYDMARAEAAAWGVKAARASATMSFETLSGTFNHSQVFEHCVAMQKAARLRIMGSVPGGASNDLQC